jgi:hypothetical protein
MATRGRFADSLMDFREARPAHAPPKRAAEEEGRSDEGGPHGSDWREGEAVSWVPRVGGVCERVADHSSPPVGTPAGHPGHAHAVRASGIGLVSAQARFLLFFSFSFSIPFSFYLNLMLNSTLNSTLWIFTYKLYLCNKNTKSEDIYLYILFIFLYPSFFSYSKTPISI